MDQTRVDLGLGGPKTTPKQAAAAPYSVETGNHTVSNAASAVWRYRAPVDMVAADITLWCRAIDGAAPVMVEAYLNGQYMVEVPLQKSGTVIPGPIELRRYDLVELRLSLRGDGEAQVNDFWVLYCARI